jgi:nitric oxide reductase large subunit
MTITPAMAMRLTGIGSQYLCAFMDSNKEFLDGAKPYRVTLLHPMGQGFWWLFVEPPLLAIAVGLFFYFVITPGLLRDLAEDHATAE